MYSNFFRLIRLSNGVKRCKRVKGNKQREYQKREETEAYCKEGRQGRRRREEMN